MAANNVNIGGSRKQPDWMDRAANRRRTHQARRPSRAERQREAAFLDWYGPESAPAEIAALRHAPRGIAEVLNEVLSGIGLGDVVVLENVQAVWSGIVGPDVARHTRPVAFSAGTLMVEVANSTWRYILEREHAARIRADLGRQTDGAVRLVRFVPPGRGDFGRGAGGEPQRLDACQ